MIGTNTMLFLTGLATLDPTLEEAARIDGAGRWRIFRSITLPHLARFIQLAFVITVIALFSALFSLIFVMTGGGPGYSTTTMEFLIYQTGFQQSAFGTAALYGIILFVITAIVGIIQLTTHRIERMTTLQNPPETDVTADEEIVPIPARPRVGRWVLFGVMVVVAAVMLYPFWVMIGESLESETQFLGSGGFSWLSWSGLTSVIPVGQEILSSTIVCACVDRNHPGRGSARRLRFRQAALSRFDRRLSHHGERDDGPPTGDPHARVRQRQQHLHLTGGYLGAILVYASLGTPFSVFLFSTYFRGVPDELIEAGIVDGLGYFGALFRLVVPVAIPAIATVTVLQFIQIWDDLLVGLLFIQNPDERPITVGLAILAAGRTTSIPELMAGSLLSALPAMIVYLVFQRYLVKGLTMGIDR